MTVRPLINRVLGSAVIFASLAIVSVAEAQSLTTPGQPLPRQSFGSLRGGGAAAPTLQSPGQMLPPTGRQMGNPGSMSSAPRSGSRYSNQFSSQQYKNQSTNMGRFGGGGASSQQMIRQSRNVRRW